MRTVVEGACKGWSKEPKTLSTHMDGGLSRPIAMVQQRCLVLSTLNRRADAARIQSNPKAVT